MKIKRKAHKGQNGKVLIVGGSEDYVGAVVLSGLAALRTGVDIVTLCAPEKVAWAINSYSPDLITKKFLGKELDITHCKEIISLSENYDVLLIGPGLGIKKDFVNKIVRTLEMPKVIDADAIKVVNISLIKNSLLTPHIQEFNSLFQNSFPEKKVEDNNDSLEEKIKEVKKIMNDNLILLKGEEDIIFNKKEQFKNRTGNDTMTVGGTGDILAGLCAGFLAQTGDFFKSAKEAAMINGKAGEYLSKRKGSTYFASELIEELWRFIK